MPADAPGDAPEDAPTGPPSTAAASPSPAGVVGAGGLPTREPETAEAVADTPPEERENPADAPARHPAPHLHPGPHREGEPLQNAMMSEPEQKPSAAGRLVLVIGIVVAIGVILLLI